MNPFERGLQKFRYYTGTPEGRNIVGKETAKNVIRTLGILMVIGTIHNAINIAEGRSDLLYTVKKGDTLWGIGVNLGADPECLAHVNKIKDGLIFPGQPVKVPSECQTLDK